MHHRSKSVDVTRKWSTTSRDAPPVGAATIIMSSSPNPSRTTQINHAYESGEQSNIKDAPHPPDITLDPPQKEGSHRVKSRRASESDINVSVTARFHFINVL